MRKSEKVKIIDELIDRATKLIYSSNSQPQKPVINDALSFVRNTIEKANAKEWDDRIRYITWGVSKARSVEAEDIRNIHWHKGRDNLINLLKSIKNEIELYTHDEIDDNLDINSKTDNEPIIFLSHCSKDKLYGDALEKFITGLGVKSEQLIYTSHSLHKIPLDANIYDYLRKNINKKVFMIFLWSEKYLDSPACLNEMGAAWVIQSDYTNIFTPNFDFGNPKFHECVIDNRKMGIVIGNKHCKTSMIELKNKVISLFGLSIDEKQSSYLLDEFMKEILEIR
jgi:hypothetical protein